jgi:hypothetical protein
LKQSLCRENPETANFSGTGSYFSNANVQEKKIPVPEKMAVTGISQHLDFWIP